MPDAAAATVQTLRVAGSDDAELAAEARRHSLALKPNELRSIAERLGRDPTLVEAYAFDAQWSEHCSYKSSRRFLSCLPTEGPTVILGPKEDAGIVRLGTWDGRTYGIVIAHESHNHPSQVVPFEGAATGIGGIVRDVLCMGARVIAVADPLRFGPRDDAHARYVSQGVVDGVAAYGNAIGVPNIAGDVYFHEGFRDNCLVNVVALGLVDAAEIIHSAAPPGSEGWDIVLVGKATDRSGFGGAAFSSLVLDEADADANKGAVQVPDPFLKNVIMRASYRVFDLIRERGLTVGFKDLGAGGIMGCTAELTGSGGFGATIDLERCPTSVPHLPPAVIAVGETQERLAWVVPPEFTPELLQIYNEEFSLPLVAHGAQAAVIGRVTAETDYVLRYHGDEVMRVPSDFLTGGIRYDRPYELPPERTFSPEALAEAKLDVDPDISLGALLVRVLAHPDVCSRRPIYERYDSVVRGTTSIASGYADAGVIVPVPGAPLALALAVDGNPRYAAIDPRRAGELAVYEAIRNVVAVGADPAGLTDCLNFGNPENPRHMGEFVASVDGIAAAAREFAVPFVSGNVSLYNESSSGHAVPGSAIIACVGAIADISKTLSAGLKRAGARLYLFGQPQNAAGGSVIADVLEVADDRLPAIDYDFARRTHALVRDAQRHGLLLSAHDISDGGLAVTVAEMIFAARRAGRMLGADIASEAAKRDDAATTVGRREFYFGEAGGFVVEVADESALDLLCSTYGLELVPLGVTTAEAVLRIEGEALPVDALEHAWATPLDDFYDEVPL